MSKRKGTGDNREVPISSRRNRKVEEAEESDGCASYDWGLEAVSDMF